MFPFPKADSRRAAALALVPTAAGLIACQPPSDAHGLAWLFLTPLVLWAGAAPGWRRFAGHTFAAFWIAQAVSMVWLRHVVSAAGIRRTFPAHRLFRAVPDAVGARGATVAAGAETRGLASRILDMLALAGLWVLLEWIKGRILTGCPWMPLAATQWRVPSMLALCAYAGPAGPGFIIVLFNLALARYAHWLTGRNAAAAVRAGTPISPWSGLRVCPEFYVGLLPIFASFLLFMKAVKTPREPLFTAGVVQTDFDPNAKWNPERAAANAEVATDLTRIAAGLTEKTPVWETGRARPEPGDTSERPDFIVWPEAALSGAIGSPGYDRFLGRLAARTDTTLLVGAVSEGAGGYYNGIHVVTPDAGVRPTFYAKRHLVPFGEYVPFADILPLRKVVPIGEDSLRGANPEPLDVTTRSGAPLKLGALVCYEDIFPELGRDMAARGADALLVVTNDAWYGREAGAYQHAATCAILAASTGSRSSAAATPAGAVSSRRSAAAGRS